MPTITTKDGTQIYYKDWGSGPAHRLFAPMTFVSRRLGRPNDVL